MIGIISFSPLRSPDGSPWVPPTEQDMSERDTAPNAQAMVKVPVYLEPCPKRSHLGSLCRLEMDGLPSSFT